MKKKPLIICIAALIIAVAVFAMQRSQSLDRQVFDDNYTVLAARESLDLLPCFYYSYWGTEEVAYFCEPWTNYYTLFPCVLGYRIPILPGECVYKVNP